jgi:hypothetical protein
LGGRVGALLRRFCRRLGFWVVGLPRAASIALRRLLSLGIGGSRAKLLSPHLARRGSRLLG